MKDQGYSISYGLANALFLVTLTDTLRSNWSVPYISTGDFVVISAILWMTFATQKRLEKICENYKYN